MRQFLVIAALSLLVLSASCQIIRFSQNPQAFVPTMAIPEKPVPFALVLGGGGSRGLAHIGVLEELEAAGLKPDLIVGCSSGAIIGALYAARPETKWIKELLLQQQASNFLNFDFTDLPFGVSSNSLLREFLKKNLPVSHFKELQIPFVAVATNLQTGELTPLFTGPLTPALLASGAVPGVFRPVEMYGTYFVDGGVADPVPVETARALRAQVVLAVEIGQRLPHSPPTNFLDIMWRSLNINYTALSKKNAALADVVVDVPLVDVGTFSDNQNVEIYILGRLAAAKAMPQVKKILQKKKPARSL